MAKTLLRTYRGTVINTFIPEVLKKDKFLEEDKVKIIGLEIGINHKNITIIKNRNSKYSNLKIKDKVIVNKYLYSYKNYDDYLKAIKDKIDTYFSKYSEKKKRALYDKLYVTETDFQNRAKTLIDYEIDFDK